MNRQRFQTIFPLTLLALISLGTLFASRPSGVLAQQPTETPASQSGVFITVLYDEPQINVRLGPSSTIYPVVGTMVSGQTAPALGRSQGGDWIQIEFPSAPNGKGWVYSPLVQLSPGALQVAEPPPTPVPPATSTVDPTLAAQFVIVPTGTRPPTFTPPAALTIPAYTQPASIFSNETLPLGSLIVAFAVLGVIGFLLSLIRR